LSNLPNHQTDIHTDPLANNQITSENNLVTFWKTPLVDGLYGLQPLYLGNNVPRATNNIISHPH
jgi:hypothetical protein